MSEWPSTSLWPKTEKKTTKISHSIIHLPTISEVSERASEQMSAAERVSEASRVEQANEGAEPANGRVAQYSHLDS